MSLMMSVGFYIQYMQRVGCFFSFVAKSDFMWFNFPTGTWVTFGGQITDEVRCNVKTMTVSRLMSWFEVLLWKTSIPKLPWVTCIFLTGLKITPEAIKNIWKDRSSFDSWVPCWVFQVQMVKPYPSVALRRIWPWKRGNPWNEGSLSASYSNWD